MKEEDKIIIKAHTSVTFTFDQEGHFTMTELRNKVRKLLESSGGKIRDIKLQIMGETE